MPILIIFRALGLTADKDILQHVVYDFGDTAMMEALRPSLEEAFPIQSQEVTLLLAPHQGHQGVPPLVHIHAFCILSVSHKSLGPEDAIAASQGHHHSLHADSS